MKRKRTKGRNWDWDAEEERSQTDEVAADMTDSAVTMMKEAAAVRCVMRLAN